MAIAIVLNPATSVTVGKEVIITGTGFTIAGNIEINCYSPATAISIKPTIVADGAGAFTSVGKFKLVPWIGGKLYVEVHDLTAGTKVTATVKVNGSA